MKNGGKFGLIWPFIEVEGRFLFNLPKGTFHQSITDHCARMFYFVLCAVIAGKSSVLAFSASTPADPYQGFAPILPSNYLRNHPNPAVLQSPEALHNLLKNIHNLFKKPIQIELNIHVHQVGQEEGQMTTTMKAPVEEPATEAPVAVDCTPRPDIQPRNITMARLSNLRLFLTWSDCGMSYADLMDEGDCIFTGKMMGDPSSSALVTGCEDEDIDVQIHSKVFGDWLFPTKDGVVQPLYGPDEPDYMHYPDYIDDGSFDEQFPVVPEGNQRI